MLSAVCSRACRVVRRFVQKRVGLVWWGVGARFCTAFVPAFASPRPRSRPVGPLGRCGPRQRCAGTAQRAGRAAHYLTVQQPARLSAMSGASPLRAPKCDAASVHPAFQAPAQRLQRARGALPRLAFETVRAAPSARTWRALAGAPARLARAHQLGGWQRALRQAVRQGGIRGAVAAAAPLATTRPACAQPPPPLQRSRCARDVRERTSLSKRALTRCAQGAAACWLPASRRCCCWRAPAIGSRAVNRTP